MLETFLEDGRAKRREVFSIADGRCSGKVVA